MPRLAHTSSAAGQMPSSGEDAQATEQDALVLAEQVVAPVESGMQRLLPPGRRAGATHEQAESIVEAPGDFLHTKEPDPSSRELERQRNPLQAQAHVGHCACIVLVEHELGPSRLCALDEQPPCIRTDNFVKR